MAPCPLAHCSITAWLLCPLQRVRLETEAGRLQTAIEEASQVIRASERRLRNAQIAQLCALGADLQAAEAQLAALRPGR